MRRLSGPLVLLLATTGTGVVSAQGYRLRFDGRAQAVSYRGLVPDSILASQVGMGPTGGPVSPDGFAVRCTGGAYCFFFRPGPERQGVPLSAAANLVLWGLGVEGLSVHANARLVADAGDAEVWPGTDPAAQLLEGYAQFQRDWLMARGGRVLVASRLEAIGFDGLWGRARWSRFDLEFTGYGGWGLGQAAAVPITSPALNPLDEFRPRDRQLVAGAEVAFVPGPVDARAEYRREVDPETDYFVSERAALSFATRTFHDLRATGGLDYNLAEGHLGSADLAVTWLQPRYHATAGVRRYRPYFSLWTLWGAFSPVPYHAVHGSAQVAPTDWLTLRGRAERYWYEAAEVSTPLVRVEDRGWRASVGATATPTARWTVDASYLAEFGPGASSRWFDAMVSWQPVVRLLVSGYGGALERPLELRFWDANTLWVGGRAEWRFLDEWRAWGDVAWFDEDRDRPDAAATAFDQLRIRGGLTLTFGSDVDRVPLPPATRRRRE